MAIDTANWGKPKAPQYPTPRMPNVGGQASVTAPPPAGGSWRPRPPTPHYDATVASPPPPAAGTESGPGILEQWFGQRAGGTDPAFEYMSKRGGDAIDNRMAAGGSFNSGARGQQLGDYMANLTSQRMGALDNLAGGASGEHQNRLDSMFRTGLGIAGGENAAASPYDFAANTATGNMNQAQLEMFLKKAGVDPAAMQGLTNNIFSAISLAKGTGGAPAK